MMNQVDKANRFAEMHIKGNPVILYNAWDAGSAKSIVEAGAKAIATSSWSVAEAQGYHDGEAIPIDLAEQIISRIAQTVNVPVTVDFEGGYSEDNGVLTDNVNRLLSLGVIGINFEDRHVKGSGLYGIDRQASRIAAIRKGGRQAWCAVLYQCSHRPVFRTNPDPEEGVEKAIIRSKAYADAGASGFFIPGLTKASLIERIVEGSSLPVNVMVMDGVPSNDNLAQLGVARISYGPLPYIEMMSALKKSAKKAFG